MATHVLRRALSSSQVSLEKCATFRFAAFSKFVLDTQSREKSEREISRVIEEEKSFSNFNLNFNGMYSIIT